MQKKTVATVALLGGLLVFALKLLSFFVSGSVALLSDALESVINIAASAMMLSSIMISEKPADTNHNYGHHKAENLSCFIEGVLILVAAFFIAEAAFGRINEPSALADINLGIIISVVATACNILISYVLIGASKKTGSIALEGDAKHIFSDVISTVGVLIGLGIVSVTGYTMLDPIMAIGVAVLIVRMGVGLIWKSSKDLMDHNSPDVEESLKNLLVGHEGRFIDYHDLKTRKSGSKIFVEFHLLVKKDATAKEAHDLCDELEAEIRKAVPGAEVLIHIEIATTGNEQKH